MDNANSPEYLRKIRSQVIENLKRTTFAPSVQMTDVPRDPEGMDDEADAVLDDLDEDDNKDQRYTKRRWDKYVEKDGELSESEDEEENESNGVRRQLGVRKRRNMMNFGDHPLTLAAEEELASEAGTPMRGRSRLGDGLRASRSAVDAVVNGSVHSSPANSDESEASSIASRKSSISQDDLTMEEGDIDMTDEVMDPAPAPAHASAEGPQEATPPDSPPEAIAAPIMPATMDDEMGDDAMDEGDTLDDPELMKEEGRQERENEDVAAEQATENAL